MEQRKRKRACYMLLLAAAAITSCAAGICLGQPKGEKAYTLYIGLNDQKTYQQEIATEEAKEKISEICLNYVDGYTISEAKGVWEDETGTITEENTLVCDLKGAGEKTVDAIMDEILSTLNQNAILVESQSNEWCYYYGQREGYADETGGK